MFSPQTTARIADISSSEIESAFKRGQRSAILDKWQGQMEIVKIACT
jgi:hypothetical protein